MSLMLYISRVIYVACVLCLHTQSPYITWPRPTASSQHWSVNSSPTHTLPARRAEEKMDTKRVQIFLTLNRMWYTEADGSIMLQRLRSHTGSELYLGGVGHTTEIPRGSYYNYLHLRRFFRRHCLDIYPVKPLTAHSVPSHMTSNDKVISNKTTEINVDRADCAMI